MPPTYPSGAIDNSPDSPADLPPNIIHLILKNFSLTIPWTKETIANCCFVSRSWCLVAQRLLLSTVYIRGGDHPRNPTRFHDFIVANPLQASYVRTVDITGAHTTIAEFLPFLAILQSLLELYLSAVDILPSPAGHAGAPGVGSFSPPPRNLSIGKITLSRVRFLDVNEEDPWAILLDFLSRFSFIRSLRLESLDVVGHNLGAPVDGSRSGARELRRTRVNDLAILPSPTCKRGRAKLANDLLDCLDLEALESIQHSPEKSDTDSDFLQTFLNGAVGLRKLFLWRHESPNLDLSSCTSLRHFEWWATILSGNDFRDMLPATIQTLSSLTALFDDAPTQISRHRHPLTDIRIIVDMSYGLPNRLAPMLEQIPWRGLRDALVKFGNLEKFQMEFHIPKFIDGVKKDRLTDFSCLNEARGVLQGASERLQFRLSDQPSYMWDAVWVTLELKARS